MGCLQGKPVHWIDGDGQEFEYFLEDNILKVSVDGLEPVEIRPDEIDVTTAPVGVKRRELTALLSKAKRAQQKSLIFRAWAAIFVLEMGCVKSKPPSPQEQL